MPAKKDTISELKREAAKADIVYLATDPDREGEAIAWHLQEALDLPDERVRRVTFHEITERAVKEAFSHVGPINMDMVNAQQARRFLDRFVGYQLSPLLWKKVARNLSAGRVQSVAVRLIADREKEIRAFVSEEYWKITATVSPGRLDGRVRPVRGRAGRVEGREVRGQDRGRRPADPRRPGRRPPTWSPKVEEVEKLDKADAPFKTSTLQQQAAIRLRFSGKRTMKIAQELYEGIDVGGDGPVGLITYMRTDSLRVSDEALTGVRDLIQAEYGDSYLPAKPNRYAAGKQAQEAHEAIRPTDLALHPEKIKGQLSPRPVQALSADLPPVRRQPDDAGRLRGHQRRDHGRRRGCSRPRARSSSSTATAASCRRPASRRTQLLPPLDGRPGARPARPRRRPSTSPSRRRGTTRRR